MFAGHTTACITMMKQLLICLFLLLGRSGFVRAANDSLLTALTHAIQAAPAYDAAAVKDIALIQQQFHPEQQTQEAAFLHYEKVYEAYRLFNYDSAYTYVLKLAGTAYALHNPALITKAKLRQCFLLLSAGLYKETYDSLRAIRASQLLPEWKGEYYSLWGRYYYDLAGYANDRFHSVDYDIEGSRYLDSALLFYPPGSVELQYYSGLRLLKQGKTAEAATFLDKLMGNHQLTAHQLALTASTLSSIYLHNGNTDKAIALLIQATVADIQSSTKETVAIFHLAELLYKQGDLKHAIICIESGIASAGVYGARQRKIQASSILPLIEGERIAGIEAQKSLLIKYAVLVTLLVLALLALAWVVLRQVKKLKQSRRALTEANETQQVINRQLEESNRRLGEANEKLEEASKIKEEYIGYFFNADAAFYSKLEKLKANIEQKLNERRYEDIRFYLAKMDARKEKEELLLSFDRIFLNLFPHFVAEVNALLREEEKIKLKEGELLNTDLRIFALMRMGVNDVEKIALILGYSVKTIYSYKSRIKNKALIPGDDFEEKMMRIKTL